MHSAAHTDKKVRCNQPEHFQWEFHTAIHITHTYNISIHFMNFEIIWTASGPNKRNHFSNTTVALVRPTSLRLLFGGCFTPCTQYIDCANVVEHIHMCVMFAAVRSFVCRLPTHTRYQYMRTYAHRIVIVTQHACTIHRNFALLHPHHKHICTLHSQPTATTGSRQRTTKTGHLSHSTTGV